MIKHLTCLAVIAAGLAACSPQGKEAPASQSAEASSAAPVVAEPNTIPAAYIGRWDDKPGACAMNTVVVSKYSLMFPKSRANVVTVTENSPTSLTMNADFTTVDGAMRGEMTLALEEDGKKLLINKGVGGIKYRCTR